MLLAGAFSLCICRYDSLAWAEGMFRGCRRYVSRVPKVLFEGAEGAFRGCRKCVSRVPKVRVGRAER